MTGLLHPFPSGTPAAEEAWKVAVRQAADPSSKTSARMNPAAWLCIGYTNRLQGVYP